VVFKVRIFITFYDRTYFKQQFAESSFSTNSPESLFQSKLKQTNHSAKIENPSILNGLNGY